MNGDDFTSDLWLCVMHWWVIVF